MVLQTVLLTVALLAGPQSDQVGSIHFPTSGKPDAQKHFLRGVAILHSFGFKEAIGEFQAAQRVDSDFAMAYWGEALCYNFPLGSEDDVASPRQVLARLAPAREERLAKAGTEKERALLSAVEILFGEGDERDRRVAYMRAMGALHERFPEDHEIGTFYSLSLLTAARYSQDRSLSMKIEAGAIALRAFNANPNHPGAAHYAIHAFDDPVHAPLALPAAHRYAEIAPSAAHALHMPSHIFIQRGVWDRVSSSNVASYRTALEQWEPGDVPADLVHAADWAQYGDLQQGDYRGARRWVEVMKEVVKNKSQEEWIAETSARLAARYTVESEEWESAPSSKSEFSDPALVQGLSAVRLGQMGRARTSLRRLQDIARESQGTRIPGMWDQIALHELTALIDLASGEPEKALESLRAGIAVAESMRPPAGTAIPVKPVHELYGEVLLELGRVEEAISAFQESLRRTPNRTRSVLGLARAFRKNSELSEARDEYRKLVSTLSGRIGHVGLEEARRFLEEIP